MPNQIAIELVRADRRTIMELLARCSKMRSHGRRSERVARVERLGALLRALVRVQEEIFYPELPLDAAVLHQARRRCAEALDALAALTLRAAQPGEVSDEVDALRWALVGHAAFDEASCFPAVGELDVCGLGDRMAARRAFLLSEAAVEVVAPWPSPAPVGARREAPPPGGTPR